MPEVISPNDDGYYCFDRQGSKFLVLGGNGVGTPVGANIPIGEELGAYPTLAAAVAAHPDASVSPEARRAKYVRGY